MRIAITGGRGRLAPVLAEVLRQNGAEVTMYSRTPDPNLEPLSGFPSAGCPDVVFHCAWGHLPLTSEADPGHADRVDIPLAERLLRLSGAARFVFLSTAAVYGDTGGEPADEERIPHPLGAYARGKLTAERRLIELGGACVLVLRVSNLIFDHADPERPQGIMPRLVEAARTGRPVEIWGDGSATKDYLHVGDFVRAVVLLCREPASGIYNVGSGTSCSLLDLCKTVEAVVGSPIRRIHLPHYDWDVSRSLLSVAKLRRACSWQPDFSIEHAIRRMTS